MMMMMMMMGGVVLLLVERRVPSAERKRTAEEKEWRWRRAWRNAEPRQQLQDSQRTTLTTTTHTSCFRSLLLNLLNFKLCLRTGPLSISFAPKNSFSSRPCPQNATNKVQVPPATSAVRQDAYLTRTLQHSGRSPAYLGERV
ncbi:uncharacterized protein IWZ02DRAFT_461745 [Phyllosticta citriasiana]|uniref:Secreted protein n=1 Tax=Phyllosticta citriasiana TaxID=595635 RepID=A0ABR1L017_9PEZI